MKRKIIQLAGKTLVVSLPIKWVKKNYIKKGQEIDLAEKGKELIIKAISESEELKTSLDTMNLSEGIVRWCLSSLHKMGYDEIEVIFNNEDVVQWVEDSVKNLFLGFIIVEQSSKRLVIRRVSQDLETEFDAALRRAFMVTLSMGESMIELFKKKEWSKFDELISLEKSNNQLTNFCERILIKLGHPNPQKTCFYYVLAWNIEKICDDYKEVCKYLSSIKNKKYSADTLLLLESSVKFLRQIYNIIYDFSFEKLELLHGQTTGLIREKKKYFCKKCSEELILVHYFFSIIKKIDDFSTSIVSINKTTLSADNFTKLD